jgi:myo-inositol-1(or 4)-monophosphatase
VRTAVTAVDLAVESYLIKTLRMTYRCRVLSEEGGSPGTAGRYRLILDPLDGTANLLRDTLGLCAISVGLELDGRPLAGAVALPYFREILVGEIGVSTALCKFSHGSITAVSEIAGTGRRRVRLPEARIIVGRGSGPPCAPVSRPLGSLFAAVSEVLNFGSCATGLLCAALQRVDGVVLPGQGYWDFAGAYPLVKNLGGEISVWDRSWRCRLDESVLANATRESRFNIIAASSRRLHEEIADLLISARRSD